MQTRHVPAHSERAIAERAVHDVIASQHGLVTRVQALGAGMTRGQIAHRLATGEWARVRPLVFVHRALRATREQALLAVVLALGEGAVASHRAAIGLWGLRGFRADVLEVSSPGVPSRSYPGVVVHRSTDLTRAHVIRHGVIPVTTPARTLLDLGAVAPEHVVAHCLEEWLADRIVFIAQLKAVLASHGGRGRRGAGILRRLLADRALGDRPADSGVEALLAKVLRDRGLPVPTHHHLATEFAAELDYAYPAARIAIEVDGYGVHLRSRATFEHERHRQNELEIAGWRVLRFTSRALNDQPDRVADQVRRMLGADRAPTAQVTSRRRPVVTS